MAGAIQTTYGFIDQRAAGQLSDMYFNEVVSRLVENTGGIEFGKAVVRGTDPATQVEPGRASVFGITVRELSREKNQRGSTAITRYNDGASASIMRRGHIYVELVTAATPVAAGDAVAALANGDIVKTGTTDSTNIAGATFESAGAAGDIVEIRLG